MTSFLFLDTIEKKFKKKLSKVLNTFENIMEKEHLLWSKCSIFHNIFKYVVFQRRQKALLWSKGLSHTTTIINFQNFEHCDISKHEKLQ